MNKLLKSKVVFYLKIVVSVGVLLYFFTIIEYKKLSDILSNLELVFIPVLLVLIFMRNVLAAVRFNVLLPAGKTVNLWVLVKQYFIAAFFNSFLPTALGGDGVRVFLLKECGIPKSQGASLIIIERFIGFFSLIVIAFVLTFFVPLPQQMHIAIIVIMTINIVIWIIVSLFRRKTDTSKIKIALLRKLTTAFVTIKLDKRVIAFTFFFSFLYQFVIIYTSYIIAVSFDMEIPLHLFLVVVPLVSFFIMIPFSLGGVGFREMSFVYLFSLFNIPGEKALIVSLGTYLTLIVGALAGAVLFFYDKVFLKAAYGFENPGGEEK
jgi:uncharacterized protein (TIRG00374 family)